MKKKIVIYGAGNNYIFSSYEIHQYYEVLGVADGDVEKIGKRVLGEEIHNIRNFNDNDFDYIVLTPSNVSGIIERLVSNGFCREKIMDLQDAFDIISDEEWLEEKKLQFSSELSSDSIAIILYGGIGDLLVAKMWIDKLIRKYELNKSKVDLYFSESNMVDAALIFREYNDFVSILSIDDFSKKVLFNNYTFILRFCIIPEILAVAEDGLSCLNEGLRDYFFRLKELCQKNYNRGFYTARDYHKTLQKFFIQKERTLYHTAYDVLGDLGASDSDKTNICIERHNEEEFINSIGLDAKTYITLNTGLNNEYMNKSNTREWSFGKWEELAKYIKSEYPEIKIVQVGLKVSEKDDIPADVHLNGKTNLEQIATVLKHSLIHIDYDGGLIHVNHMVGGKSIVLMGPTSSENHEYPENIYINSSACEACEWTTADWLSVCPKGEINPRCMDRITIDMVMTEIEKIVKE